MSSGAAGSAQLILDGYNVLHAWSSRVAAAPPVPVGEWREQFLLVLENYAAFVDREITVVFDARKGKADTQALSSHVTVIFAPPRYSADQVIERMVRETVPGPGTVVVTSDKMERLLVMGAGVATMSAQLFVEELLVAQQELSGFTAQNKAGVPPGRKGVQTRKHGQGRGSSQGRPAAARRRQVRSR